MVRPDGSDSATFDNVLELLMLAGRSLPHAAMMMIPEAYRDRDDLCEDLKGFYAYHACLMEPWDGPAAVCFTDGRVIGATLDRNGLRPGRWVETNDGMVVLGSEIGLLDIKPEDIKRLGRLQPGKLFLVDLEKHCIVEDEEVKREIATQQPYGEWFDKSSVHFDDLPTAYVTMTGVQPTPRRQQAFGYTQEDLRVLIAPMAATGAEPIGSMGNDIALPVLSDNRPPLYSYFKQLFAQVTNPPIDPIREEVVMSLAVGVGSEQNLLTEDRAARPPALPGPADPDEPGTRNDPPRQPRHLPGGHDRHHLGRRRRTRRARRPPRRPICEEAEEAIEKGFNILILSDRRTGPRRVPIPALLAVAAVHHHLVRAGTRLRAGHGARIRRAARGSPHGDPDRLRLLARSTRT